MVERRPIASIVGALIGVVLVALPHTTLEGQEEGFLAGVVLDEDTGAPLAEATLTLLQMAREAVAGENGQFLLEGVPLGALEVRFEAPGYVSVVEELELSAAGFLQVRLSRVEAVLDELLVIAGRPPSDTRAGEIRVREDEESWRSVLNLLEDQVPGVVVGRDGGLGDGASIVIRGAGSFNDNRPEVYLDGVRIHDANDPTRALHILDLIPAETVARIQVLKGASGGAGFALGGANGVIVIETRRGSSQPGR